MMTVTADVAKQVFFSDSDLAAKNNHAVASYPNPGKMMLDTNQNLHIFGGLPIWKS